MSRLVLDAGAFIAFERGDHAVRGWLAAARGRGLELTTCSPVVAQVWRAGRRQALLARLLGAVRIDAPDEAAARRAGELLARSGTSDVVDALVVGLARTDDTIVTSDPVDLGALIAAARVRARLLAV
jgi:predicted nucleic acid-binding protein